MATLRLHDKGEVVVESWIPDKPMTLLTMIKRLKSRAGLLGVRTTRIFSEPGTLIYKIVNHDLYIEIRYRDEDIITNS